MIKNIYTDASFQKDLHHPYYGWAFVVLDGSLNILNEASGAYKSIDNNLGEIQAILEAIKGCGDNDEVFIHSDSEIAISFCKEIVNKNINIQKLKKTFSITEEDVVFANLIEKIWQHKTKVNFVKVKAHSGDYWNNFVDKQAKNILHRHMFFCKEKSPPSIKFLRVDTTKRKRLLGLCKMNKVGIKEIADGHFFMKGINSFHYFLENKYKIAFGKEVGFLVGINPEQAIDLALDRLQLQNKKLDENTKKLLISGQPKTIQKHSKRGIKKCL